MKEIHQGLMEILSDIQVLSLLTNLTNDKLLPLIKERKKWVMGIVIRTGQNSN